jgi:hypothetical protein
MQMQKAVRVLPVAKRLLLAAALLEEGESLVHRIATAVSSAKASAKHLCLMTFSPGQRFKQAAYDHAQHGAQIAKLPISTGPGPVSNLSLACQASSRQPRLTATSLNPRQPSTSTHVNPSTSTGTLVWTMCLPMLFRLLLLILQFRTQPHLGCCLAAATVAASPIFMHL